MITQESSIKSPNKSAKIVVLEINSEFNMKIKNSWSYNHKLRKQQYTDSFKQFKGIRNLQKIDFNQFLKQNEITEQVARLSQPKNYHQSSYLAYKAEQKYYKAKHSNKSKFLKSRHLKQKFSLDFRNNQDLVNRPNQTFDVPRNKRKMSMVQLGQCLSEGNDEVATLNHSRNLYMKTSQGKRQKIDANTFISKIKEKIQQFWERQNTESKVSNIKLWREFQQMPIKINQFHPDKHTQSRNIRTRSIKKEVMNLRVDDKVNDCRPWSSNKSELPQQ